MSGEPVTEMPSSLLSLVAAWRSHAEVWPISAEFKIAADALLERWPAIEAEAIAAERSRHAEEVGKLREALPYVQHFAMCDANRGIGRICTCGLKDILRELVGTATRGAPIGTGTGTASHALAATVDSPVAAEEGTA